MAFLEVIGELFGFSDNKTWSLVGDDTGYEDLQFKGQFPAENYAERGGNANLGEATTLNKSEPNYQWLYGDGEIVSFRARLFALNSFKNIKQQIETLKSFKKRKSDLKRPPKFLFTYGTEIQFTCFIRQIDYEYDELRNDGSIRGAIITISLQKLDDTLIGTEAASTSLASQVKFAAGVIGSAAGILSQVKSKINIPFFSVHTLDKTIIAKDGDTFESIAQRQYGNALLGDLLRNTQPDKVNLKTGDSVILLDPIEINEISVTPRSIPLKATPENSALRNEFLDLRHSNTTIFI